MSRGVVSRPWCNRHRFRPASVSKRSIPLALALAGWGVVELERVRYAMPERPVPDMWNYVGAVLAAIRYAAAL
jgi:hypothetical protein